MIKKLDEDYFLNLPDFDGVPHIEGKMFHLEKSMAQYNEMRHVFVGVITTDEENDFIDIVEVIIIR